MPDPVLVTQEGEDPSAAPEFSVSLWDGDTADDVQFVIHIKKALSSERKASPALLMGLAIMVADQQGVLNNLVESIFPLGPPTEIEAETLLNMIIQGNDDVPH